MIRDESYSDPTKKASAALSYAIELGFVSNLNSFWIDQSLVERIERVLASGFITARMSLSSAIEIVEE